MIRSSLAPLFTVAALALAACGSETDSSANTSAGGSSMTSSSSSEASTSSAASSSTTSSSASGTGMPTSDIVDTAIAAGSFKTLVAAVQAADLESTLRGEGPFTVFAPTDEAFGKLPPGTLDSLLKPENKEALAEILTYHVVAGNVSSAQAMALSSATTVNGADVAIEVNGDKLNVGGATVIAADIGATNGTIHVIDAVLMPPAK